MAYSGLITHFLGQGTAAARPADPGITPDAISFWWSTDTNEMSAWVEGAWVENIFAAGVWGGITGTLSAQTDLQAALDAKPTAALDTDGTLAANSDARVATQKAVKTYVDNAVTGLLDFKGAIDASANPNYPAALKGDAYVISVSGKVGGAAGIAVDIGDVVLAIADNAGGTQAAVGASWDQLEHNLVGALLSANNLSDLGNAATARGNLGLGYFATGTDAANLTGTVAASRLPQYVGGDVTTGGTGSVNLMIGANKVTRGMLAQAAGATILGAAGAGNVIDLTAAQAKTFLAITATDVSGLAAVATSGSASDLGAGTLPASAFPALTGDVTTVSGALATTIAGGAVTTTKIAASAITYAKIQDVAATKLLGNPTGGAAAPSEINLGGGLSFSGTTLRGAVVHPGYVAGNWYCPVRANVIGGGAAIPVNSIRLLPFTLSKPITVSDLGARVSTLSAGGNFQLAIYANDPATGRPTGTALCSTGNISTAVATAVSATVGSSVLLPPGTYWMAINQDNSAAVYNTIASTNSHQGYLIGSATLANIIAGSGNTALYLFVAQTFGTWPDLTSAAFSEATNTNCALVFLKAA